MKLRKLISLGLSLTMALSLSVTAFANEVTSIEDAEGSLTGDGEVGFVYDSDVFKVVLPVVDDDTTTFDFTLDPQGVLNALDEDDEYEDGSTLFFANDGGTYSNTSDELTITNKSNFAVTATVSATVTGLDTAVMTTDSSFEDDTAASVFLALTDTTNTSAISNEEAGKISSKIDGCPDGYEVTYDDGNYSYGLKSDWNTFATYSFQLKGACNPAADWTDLADITPQVVVTWSVDKYIADTAPAMTELEVAVAETIDLSTASGWDLGNGTLAATGIASIAYDSDLSSTQKKYVTLTAVDGTTLTVTDTGVSKINAATEAPLNPYTITITLNDADATEVTVKIVPAG